MITDETTPDLLRQAAAEWVGDTTSDHYARHGLRARADRLEREQGLLPIRPGWYQNIVVESGEEKFRGGAMFEEESKLWRTPRAVNGSSAHLPTDDGIRIYWADQDGMTPEKTPGRTLWAAIRSRMGWSTTTPEAHDHSPGGRFLRRVEGRGTPCVWQA